jgi:Fe2+ or Zn2+ uptake regulation protein
MRYSRQRELIKEVVFSTNAHPPADWVYDKVKKTFPNISLGTIYRNLKQLSKIGIIRTVYDGSVARFDWNTTSHNHFKCIECGKITDIEIDSTNTFTKRNLDNSSFDVHDIEITFIGTCKEHKNNK